MDAKDRKTLNARFQEAPLPERYSTEMWDDFINYTPEGKATGCRVLRIVGPRRHLVLFAYTRHPFAHHWGQQDYEMFYLTESGDLEKFVPKRVHQVYNEEYGHEVGWERAVGEWLTANGAKSFVGRGWLDNLAGEIRRLVAWWEKDFSLLDKEG